jgi:hypothetical protein
MTNLSSRLMPPPRVEARKASVIAIVKIPFDRCPTHGRPFPAERMGHREPLDAVARARSPMPKAQK